ncbi:hypothetical protein ECIV_ORF51 [European chub iridovirus]|nr:hypothetical protein ECIV_ORF51 [European chub iridovirus]
MAKIEKIKTVFIFSNIVKDKIMISLYTTQTNRDNARLPANAPCSCGGCSSFSTRVQCDRQKPEEPTNWNVGQESCCGGFCTSQPLCVPPNAGEVNIGNSSKNQNPLIYAAYFRSAPNLIGQFNKTRIDTSAQLMSVFNKFQNRSENSANLNDIANTFCGQISKVGDKTLSTINNPNADGNNWCTRWFNKLSNTERDIFIQRYCSRNPKASDCKCANRAQDPIYNKTKELHVFNDGCWYSSCSDSINQILPSNVLNPTCPSNICQAVFNLIDTGAVTIDDVKNEIKCNFDNYKPKIPWTHLTPSTPNRPKPDPPKPKPTPPKPDPPKPKPTPPKPDVPSFIEQYKYHIAAGVVLFAFLLYFGLK